MRSIARQICELKLRARDAIVSIRKLRPGRSSPGSADTLNNEVVALLDGGQTRHPDFTFDQMAEAFRGALDAVSMCVRSAQTTSDGIN
jgi:hypothetical protein